MQYRLLGSRKSTVIVRILAITVLVAFGPMETAQAYIDPNAAGPLYQMLFPLIVAITSAYAAFRRTIALLWARAIDAILRFVRRESPSPDSEDPVDPS